MQHPPARVDPVQAGIGAQALNETAREQQRRPVNRLRAVRRFKVGDRVQPQLPA